ncbi:NAD dependent epimerase [Colletotrichum tofieldiae]|nr:NAD dependent epimerase [Colletotrichum tofieldiae]GKT69104.1 NAD dependent epimerase [Colletotrichum tofieldiae]
MDNTAPLAMMFEEREQEVYFNAAQTDLVLHLATAYVFGGAPYETFGPTDLAAVSAIADALAGTNKPLVVTSGALSVAADPTGAETTEASPAETNPTTTRIKTELHSLSLASRGIRVMSVRLAPYVYGSVTIAALPCTSTMPRLFLLAAAKGRAGEIYNASSAADIASLQLSRAMAAAVDVPLRDVGVEDARAFFLAAENKAPGAKAKKELGWSPRGPVILEEISKGSYREVAKARKR